MFVLVRRSCTRLGSYRRDGTRQCVVIEMVKCYNSISSLLALRLAAYAYPYAVRRTIYLWLLGAGEGKGGCIAHI